VFLFTPGTLDSVHHYAFSVRLAGKTFARSCRYVLQHVVAKDFRALFLPTDPQRFEISTL
jgi:hypothetical protein